MIEKDKEPRVGAENVETIYKTGNITSCSRGYNCSD